MNHYPTSVSQYVSLGKLLASCLEISVLKFREGENKDYGAGWSYDGPHFFGVTSGGFPTDDGAYADLAARCIDACSIGGERYNGFVTDEGRERIRSALETMSFLEELKAGVRT